MNNEIYLYAYDIFYNKSELISLEDFIDNGYCFEFTCGDGINSISVPFNDKQIIDIRGCVKHSENHQVVFI